MKEIISKWNAVYFGNELSQTCLDEFNAIDTDDRELVDFIDTWLFYSHKSGGGARDCSPLAAKFFARIAKSYMPSLWAKIPPITQAGRMRGIDHVAHDVLDITPDQDIHFLEVGCGYPPFTTMETAESCPQWRCVGIDPNFPMSILLDDEGNSACFDEAGTLVYIQYPDRDMQPPIDRVLQDQRRYALEWERIQQKPSLREELACGKRLIKNPVRHYTRDNLCFCRTTFKGLQETEKYDLIRCMNVFTYFDGPTILENISHAKSLLRDSGVFISGSVGERGVATRYLVYQKHGNKLTPQLFGLDLGKFSRIEGNGWWAFHKNQPDTLFLAKIVRLVSDNGNLFNQVSGVIDRVGRELGYSHRDQNGYLHQKAFLNLSTEYDHLLTTLANDCGQQITSFLEASEIYAQVTSCGHLLIDLSRSSPKHYEEYFPVL